MESDLSYILSPNPLFEVRIRNNYIIRDDTQNQLGGGFKNKR